MAKPPAWLKVSAPYFEGNKAFVNIRIRVRHPAFLWKMWGLFRQESRRLGHNPNDPRVVWVSVRSMVRIIMKGTL